MNTKYYTEQNKTIQSIKAFSLELITIPPGGTQWPPGAGTTAELKTKYARRHAVAARRWHYY
jgi:hypothetical protein